MNKVKKTAKILALVLALCMVIACFAACNNATEDPTNASDDAATDVVTDEATEGNSEDASEDATAADVALDYSDIKVGFIFLHAPTDSTYDKNFMNAVEEVQANLGLSDDQVIVMSNIPESSECYEAAMDLVDEGCNIIFGDSFGHEPYLMQAAQECPDVQFCHATGDDANTAEIANYHNAFASIYEGRYVAGIVAGMKINEMIADGKITADQAKMGYVGAFPYAEVISGYTSFYLGAKSVCPTVTMDVKYTNSWFDIDAERTQAIALIESGCVLISQHADSEGAPKACEEYKVPNVAYNVNTSDMGPTTALISSKINWAPYMTYMINCVASGEEIVADWCGGFAEGSVELTELNTAVAAEGTQEAIDAAVKAFKEGTLHVYDTATFTVNGEALTSYMADVVPDANYEGDTEVIVDGHFAESEFRSAPYFNIIIDGITAVTE
ncbi:MAG: BMP family ABC transporter substrate-binding protein [Clostridia bacterium]|nr:BMP family ABC transporter substrate-binding protein [Clostridia bacterium]